MMSSVLSQYNQPKYYMWIEKPLNPGFRLFTAGDNVEPYGHLSLAIYSIDSVGNRTLYTSYSFALDLGQVGLNSELPYVSTGTTYRDKALSGPIVEGTVREFDFFTGNKIVN